MLEESVSGRRQEGICTIVEVKEFYYAWQMQGWEA